MEQASGRMLKAADASRLGELGHHDYATTGSPVPFVESGRTGWMRMAIAWWFDRSVNGWIEHSLSPCYGFLFSEATCSLASRSTMARGVRVRGFRFSNDSILSSMQRVHIHSHSLESMPISSSSSSTCTFLRT